MVGTMRRATYTGAEEIKAAFESLYKGDVCYSVWPNNLVPCFQYTGEDHDQGLRYFEGHIDALDQAGNDELFFLRFHPLPKKNTWIDKKSITISETPFRVTELDGGKVSGSVEPYSSAGSQVNYKMFEAIQLIKDLPLKMDERQTAFEARMLAMLDEEPEPVVPEVDPVEKYVGMAIGALKEPNVMANVIGLIKMFIPSYNPTFMQQQNTAAINGVTDAPPGEAPAAAPPVDLDKLDQALLRLSKHCKLDDDLTKLADIAENNPQYFKLLLTGLRS